MMKSSLFGIFVSLGLLSIPEGVALANGRFPASGQLVVDPRDPTHIAVETTYGVIQTRDAGKDWTYICEDALQYGGNLDPPIGICADGTLIAGVFDGLSVSTADACSFAYATNGLEQRYVVDVAVQKDDPTRAIAVSSNGLSGNVFDTRLFQTSDSAKTWSQAGVSLPSDFLALTSDVAPSDPNRVYLSGFKIVTSTSYVGSLARSSDRGATWEVVAIPGSDNASGPYVAAVDPNDAATIYVRLAGDVGKLLVSHDAGTTWTTAYTAKGKLLAFALSPDGKTVLVGGDSDGVLRASTSDLAFTQLNQLEARCLTWAGDVVYACGREAQPGFSFTVGVSHDQGATFEPLYHLSCLEGPSPTCPASSDVATKCPGPWAIVSQTIQADTCMSSSSTGTGGSSPKPQPSSGCCAVAATDPGASAPAAAVALLAMGAAVARRRRRPRRRAPIDAPRA